MKPKRNTIAKGLMISSVLLLVILQFLWIRSSYEKAFMDFRGDTNLLFRSTVIALRNANWMKGMVEIKDDSLALGRQILLHDSTLLAGHPTIIHGNPRIIEKTDTLIASRRLGIQKIMLRSRTSKARDSIVSDGKSFIIRIETDTLNPDSLREQVTKALKSTSINNPFSTKLIKQNIPFDSTIPPLAEFMSGSPNGPNAEHGHRQKNLRLFSDTVKTDLIRAGPGYYYEATFYNVRSHILTEILPQVIFSLILTLLIIAAFYLLMKNIQAQARLMEAKNDFINNVTHELKTPVATVSVALEAFRNFDAIRNPSLTKEYLDIAQRELARLISISDKILRTSVIEEQAVAPDKRTIDLLPLLTEVVSSMKVIANSTGATIELQTAGNDFSLDGSAEQLQGMLYNLLDNALRYRAADKPTKVVVTAEKMESVIRISVRDNGMGIHKSFHSRIFEKFFRVPLGDVHNIKGYGLGLNFVGTVVKNHHGQIDVKSIVGEGSEFIILLPVFNKN